MLLISRGAIVSIAYDVHALIINNRKPDLTALHMHKNKECMSEADDKHAGVYAQTDWAVE